MFDGDTWAELATGRRDSYFSADMDNNRAKLHDSIAGRRFLVIGGAGSIGSATLARLADFGPATLHVVDQDENGLAELVRHLRSRQERLSVGDFRTLPLDYGGTIMRQFLASQPPYDGVLNFSAMKHVRSEKDSYSLLRILETNVLKLRRFLGWLREFGHDRAFFSVSTDKAANPTSLMGASKRIMEHTMFAGAMADGDALPGMAVRSARFANVAFSNGSLLQAFLIRLQRRQPLAAPRATKRYFVSPKESGEICMLAGFAMPSGMIAVPALDPARDLIDISSVAERLLEHQGLTPVHYDDEAAAVANVAQELAQRRYPLLLTPLDTSGEKPYEEFVGAGESVADLDNLASLRGVPYLPAASGALSHFQNWLEATMTADTAPEKAALVLEIARLVPQMKHIETGRSLDTRV